MPVLLVVVKGFRESGYFTAKTAQPAPDAAAPDAPAPSADAPGTSADEQPDKAERIIEPHDGAAHSAEPTGGAIEPPGGAFDGAQELPAAVSPPPGESAAKS